MKTECPYARCKGELISQGEESTCMGWLFGVDPNQKVETLKCSKCDRYVSRAYKWEAVPINKEL